MFDMIKEQAQTIEGIKDMFTEHLQYAWKWMEEGQLQLSGEIISEMAFQLCLRGL